MPQGKLFLIPNVLAENTAMEVISPQVREVIAHTNYFLVENLRTARRYISSLKLGINIEELHLEILDKDTPPEEVSRLMRPLLNGSDIGVISEAGCPGIADPGALVVAYAHQKGIQVVPLDGLGIFGPVLRLPWLPPHRQKGKSYHFKKTGAGVYPRKTGTAFYGNAFPQQSIAGRCTRYPFSTYQALHRQKLDCYR